MAQNNWEQILNDYLKEVCKNSYHCQHCTFWHPNGEFCLFAYDCVKNDFNKMTEED